MNDLELNDLRKRLTQTAFPRSAGYDPNWLLENVMGPNVLWLTEWLSQAMDLQPGLRILDLGCGRAASSVFLAKEFGATVFAADLWIKPADNWRRILEAGVAQHVIPLHAEAHALPFAHGFFDAIVSLDAYHYFGTDELYLGYCTQFLRPGGSIGIVAPGIKEEMSSGVPPHLLPYWEWEFCSFHSPAWWRTHWEKTGLVHVDVADSLHDGGKLWQEWNELCAAAGPARFREPALREAEMLKTDAGRTLGFTRIVAHDQRPVTNKV